MARPQKKMDVSSPARNNPKRRTRPMRNSNSSGHEAIAAHLRRMGIYSEAKVPMSLHTSVGVGGPVDVMAFPDACDEAVRACAFAIKEKMDFFILGEGTNLLVSDAGMTGMVINMSGVRGRRLIGDSTIEVIAGEPLPNLAHWAASEGLSGIEFACGIPGTIGGAIVMNAGAYGAEMAHVVKQITILPPHEEKTEKVDYASFSPVHRTTNMEEGTIILKAELQLQNDNEAEVQARMREILDKRRQSQPIGIPSFGCAFKNPTGEHAGRLIEELKLKGTRRGGAVISEVHGNFIINEGGAKARDFLKLFDIVKKRALEQKGIRLELEVKVVGRN